MELTLLRPGVKCLAQDGLTDRFAHAAYALVGPVADKWWARYTHPAAREHARQHHIRMVELKRLCKGTPCQRKASATEYYTLAPLNIIREPGSSGRGP